MQSELFELSSSRVSEDAARLKPTFIERTSFTLRLDQTISLVIVLMVFYVLTFTWGVERGKRLILEGQTVKPSAAAAETVVIPERPVVKAGAGVPVSADVPVSISELPRPVAAVNTAPKSEMNKLGNKPVGKYTIQYVTYVTQSAADREVRRIAKLGHSSFVVPTGKHFLVCIEAFQTRQEASKLLKQLKAQRTVSADAYVRSVPV